jgi:Xaa-Pro dipeptidase
MMIGEEMRAQRTLRLKELMKSEGMDHMVLIPGPNLHYFSGLKIHAFEQATMLFFTLGSRDVIFLPTLEFPNASSILGDDYGYYQYTDEEGPDKVLHGLAKELNLDGKKIGIEFLTMRVMEYELLRKYCSRGSFVNGEPIISQIRMCKDDEEISHMRRAADITQRALDATLEMIRPGVTEHEIGNQLKIQAFSLGSGELHKEPIVTSGPRTASPHAKTSDRRINAGELVMIDTGASSGGYACDLTRTFAVGSIDDEFRKIYGIVKKANEAVIGFPHPKFTAEELDGAAREYIEAQGYGQFFIHRTGHGLGLEEHEPPYIVKGNKMEMRAGMTFTVEPGIYLPGKGGVRIEDNVVVTSGGLEKLTSYPTELTIL